MDSITSLASKLAVIYQTAYPRDAITFTEGSEFDWNHERRTVRYNTSIPHSEAYLLHEFSHALLGHEKYDRDVELITMERDAWHKATQLAEQFDIEIPPDLIEDSLDTYRDWLHARSTCPTCGATGLQTGELEYTCLACRQKWRVNLAKHRELRRYKQ